jgi:hypothetical protein
LSEDNQHPEVVPGSVGSSGRRDVGDERIARCTAYAFAKTIEESRGDANPKPDGIFGKDSGCPHEPLVSYRINRQLSVWNLPPLMMRAFGALCQLADSCTATNDVHGLQ